jgi:hypothetical protein
MDQRASQSSWRYADINWPLNGLSAFLALVHLNYAYAASLSHASCVLLSRRHGTPPRRCKLWYMPLFVVLPLLHANYWVRTSESASTVMWSLVEREWTLSSGNSALGGPTVSN